VAHFIPAMADAAITSPRIITIVVPLEMQSVPLFYSILYSLEMVCQNSFLERTRTVV
jgi:hypothetical protein